MRPFISLAKVGLAVATVVTTAMASASPIFTSANIDFSGRSTSFGYQGTQFTFTDLTSGFDFNPVAITTAAGAGVTALGAPFYNPPQPTTYFDPIRGDGHLVFDASYLYNGFTNVRIPFSATPSFIGLALALSDGTHYGYARFAGTELVSYAFESVAGLGIDAAGAFAAPVPEPETIALMLAGIGMLGLGVRRNRRASTSGGLVIV